MIDRVIGNYRVVEKVGEGGMGTVYRAVDVMLEREVAIKAIRPELSREPEIVERFRAEAKMLARLSHPAIATIYSFFVDGEDVFLAMEFVRGRSLSGLLQSAGPLPWERAVPLLAGALDGIEQAHRVGIVHRDLKSDNLMVTAAGTVKVMDFGIARLIGSSRLTRTGLLVGTLHYMAPEQIRGEDVDRRTDVYALGAVLYEMVTGRVPFQGASDYAVLKAHVEENPAPPSVAMPGLPAWLDQAILKALSKAPAERFQTVEELRLFLLGQGAPAAAGPTLVIPAADQPTLHMAPTVAAVRPPAAATPPASVMPPPGAPSRSGRPAEGATPAAHRGWAGGRRVAALVAAAAIASLLAVILYRRLAAPLVPPRAPQAAAGGARTAGGAVGPKAAGAAGSSSGAAGAAAAAGATGGTGPAAASAAAGASAPKAGMASGAVPGMTPGATSGSSRGTIPATTSGSAPGGAATRPAAPRTAAASTGGEGAATGMAPSPPAAARARGKRTRLGAADGQPATGRAGVPADGTSPTSQAGRSATGADNQGGGGERAATSAGAGGGSAAGGTPDDELRQLGIEIETESDQIRNLYADFLSQKEKGGSRLSDSDDKLKDELKDLQRAAEGFHAQFQTGFWARTRNRFGRLGHSEDQKAQVARVARTLVGSGSRVDALMAEVKPDPAVRELWRRIHQQCRRIAEVCGL
jgi:tRNA A-37 threonylcarbamoyl transferase component Bud32